MIDALLSGLQASPLAQLLRYSRWGYAAVNTLHVLGIALLVGAIAPLDLRLLGLWRGTAVEMLGHVLVPMAAGGLLLAIAAGLLLFSTRAPEYAALGLFRFKMLLVASGTLHALWLHTRRDVLLASTTRRRLAGGTSLSIWLAVLVSGRMLAFVGE